MVAKGGKHWSGVLIVPACINFQMRLVLLLVALLSSTAGASLGQDQCDNKVEFEKGEGPGPFFGFEYALYAYALAEKVCGAPAISMTSKVLQAAEREGCGPGTPIYAVLNDSIRTMEKWDLKDLAQDGRADLEMSQEQVGEWARTTTEEFGGCAALLDFHSELQGGFSFER